MMLDLDKWRWTAWKPCLRWSVLTSIAVTVGYAKVPIARASIGKYLDCYNGRRPQHALDQQTPFQAYLHALPPIPVAA
jgi:putative transposase